MNYTISEAANHVGVAASTLRYYEKEGLIPHVKRKNGNRIFDDADIRHLRLLNCLKNTGMPIKRIKEYVDLAQKGNATLQERHDLIKKQRRFVQDQIDQLQYYMQELDFKNWYYEKALAQGTEQGIDFEAYEWETGRHAPRGNDA